MVHEPSRKKQTNKQQQRLVQRKEENWTYLFARFCIKQDPAKLDNLSRVLGYVDAMFVTGGSYVNDYVFVDVVSLRRSGRHSESCGK